jgi:threonine/homoserine/homoserine lactone efflux protein
METWMGYFILGFALSTPIGPVNIEMIRQGISSGFYPSWLVGLGDVISNLLIVGIILYGFSSGIVDVSYLAFIAVAGGAYLIYLGASNLKTKLSISSWPRPVHLLAKGFVLGFINPMDFLSWSGVYSTIHQHPPSFLITAFTYLMIGCGMWNLLLSLSVSWCRPYIKPAFIQGFQLISGLILCGYGIFLAWFGFKMLVQ